MGIRLPNELAQQFWGMNLTEIVMEFGLAWEVPIVGVMNWAVGARTETL